ncbi:HNH endonuclease signature motif containing protein [Streptomyces sp. NPDC050803]|uniref:HNH endonuclease signature motif containing protein n=1 Tax=unclassified Streptomyces TaxID=2593676 RepID=UPI0034171573
MDKKPRRYYSNATIAALMTLARGGCYWPDCNVPTVRMINGAPRLNLEIAHIRAFEEGGKRFEPKWSVKERNSFDNLILLCNPHHEEVDGPDSDNYPVEALLGWKHAREADGLDALAGLGELTTTKLGEMIAAAQGELVDRIGPALDEFAKTAPEVAALLKAVMKELADPRVHGFGISEDGINTLQKSARTFANLEDSANMLANAADTLKNLEDSANTLADAADSLVNLGDNAKTLVRAADKALKAADSLVNLPDSAKILSAAADKALRAADTLGNTRY